MGSRVVGKAGVESPRIRKRVRTRGAAWAPPRAGLIAAGRLATLPRESQQISVRFLGRDPSRKYHTILARDGEQIAVPRGLGGVGGQGLCWCLCRLSRWLQ